ncbi:transport integral membrane protein [Streptomyces viridiviolaceus]|nr:transport integral membrane protein [Streptomyces viridiviolaceus]
MRPGRRGVQRLVLLGVVLVLLLLGGVGPASAHAALTATDPGDGTVLRQAPRSVTLTFTETVGLRDDSFRVLDPGGHRVETGEAGRADGRSDTARVTLRGKLGEGTYTVAWRVISADSHPVSGAFTFSVGRPSATTAVVDPGPTEDPLTGSLHKLARYLAHLAAALLIGTASFVALCRPPEPAPLRRLLVAGWWTLLAATLALLVLRAPYEAGSGPAAALDPEAFGGTLTSRPGALLLVRLGLLMVTRVFLARAARLPRRDGLTPYAAAPGLALAVGLALTWAAAEHASAGIQVPLAMASTALHLLATAVWLGGLAALLVTLRRPTPAAVVARFSRLAFTSVTVLVVTGVYQSWRGLGSWSALTGTTYGRLLLAKLAAVVLLLAAAALSRRWTARLVTADAETVVREHERVPEPVGAGPPPLPEPSPQTPVPEPVGAGPPPLADPSPQTPVPEPAPEDAHRRALRRSVLAEAVIAAAVLVITTVLTGTPPARAAAEAAGPAPAGGVLPASVTTIPFDVGTPGGRGTVQITLDPGRTGDNAVQAVVFGADGGLAAVPELRLSFTLPDRGIGPIGAELVDRGGYWSANSVTLPLPGTWTMKATVRVSEVDQVSESRKVRIAP